MTVIGFLRREMNVFDSRALFPSRSSDRCTTQAVRDMLHKVAAEVEIKLYKIDEPAVKPAT
jgi:site-specific recombinase XerD